ncbi:hypothetical protein NCCNTM_06530 [Mycolicibacterium sp. NCC-Tsukiji]|nr:hypothetical protein NCCNTM_06530 [Mycolicibacterium sp. NCC-Tsukiji]
MPVETPAEFPVGTGVGFHLRRNSFCGGDRFVVCAVRLRHHVVVRRLAGIVHCLNVFRVTAGLVPGVGAGTRHHNARGVQA